MWRLYTDGSVRDGTVGTAAVLFYGNQEVYRVWGAVQFDPRGGNYCGARTVSSGTGELAALLLFCLSLLQQGSWSPSRSARHDWVWPTTKLLLCSDSSTALQVIAGAATGSTEPALSSMLYDTCRTFFHDRGIELALQKVPAHAGIPGNETADKSAKDATLFQPGTYSSTHTYLSPTAAVALEQLSFAPQLLVWPDPPPAKGRPKGAQTCTYLHYKGKYWLKGVVGSVASVRLTRWWGCPFNFTWLLSLFTAQQHQPPRLKWCVYTALLGEWPTGCKLRHWSTQPTIKPKCRFCGVAEDCLRHWFGPNSCSALLDKIRRSTPLCGVDPQHGWFASAVELPAWDSIFTAVYAVHSLLRWRIGPDDFSNHASHLREGVWLARCHELDLDTEQQLAAQARKAASKRASKHRAKARLKDTIKHITNCSLCGQITTTNHPHNCPLLPPTQAHLPPDQEQAGGVSSPAGG
jgi:ribonuclease HI